MLDYILLLCIKYFKVCYLLTKRNQNLKLVTRIFCLTSMESYPLLHHDFSFISFLGIVADVRHSIFASLGLGQVLPNLFKHIGGEIIRR